VDGCDVLRGVLALFAKNEVIFSQALDMALAKRPMESVKRGIGVASRGNVPVQKQRRLMPSICKKSSAAVGDEDTALSERPAAKECFSSGADNLSSAIAAAASYQLQK
jgi:hypothetical protein